jgi:thioesterase domain-containing protein/acyl carrier protein
VIDYHGRGDDQVQISGARVELGEIEAALRMHGSIGDAVVVLRESGSSQRLYAYLRRVHDGRPDPPTEDVRRSLSAMLPDYMTPARYVWLDEFPFTPSGKVDRRALVAHDAPRPVIEQPFETPRPGLEERLARMWRDELQLDRIGRHDNFHLLGGDSLSSIRLFTAIAEGFGLELPPDEVLRSPTLAALAAVIDARRPKSRTSSIVPLRSEGDQAPLFLPPSMAGQLFFCRELVQALDARRPVYGFSLPPDFTGPNDIPGLAALFVADLLAFQKEGPYHLAGYSFSAALALEMAQQLRALSHTVGVLAMIDYGPGVPSGWSGRLRTAGHFVTNLPHWLRYDILQSGVSSLGARVRRKLASVGSRVRTMGPDTPAQIAERAVDEIYGRDELPESHRRLTIARLKEFYQYRPSVYDGHVLLFWARCRPLLHSLSPDLGWEQYAAGGFDRIVVRCNHDNILAPPHVDVIAKSLDRAIATWHA